MIILFEGLKSEDIVRINNYLELEYSNSLRIPSGLEGEKRSGKDIFEEIKKAPVIKDIQYLPSFYKSLKKVPSKVKSSIPLIQFAILTLSKGKEGLFPSNYKFHPIPKETPGHHVVHIGGDYALRFQIFKDKVIIRDFLTHAERNY